MGAAAGRRRDRCGPAVTERRRSSCRDPRRRPEVGAPAARKVLEIRDLTVDFVTEDGLVHAVDHVSYDVYAGETLGVVGESGSGKSVTWLAAMGLLRRTTAKVSGSVMMDGQNLLELSTERRSARSAAATSR